MTNKSNICIDSNKLESILYVIDGYEGMVKNIREESVSGMYKESDIEKRRFFTEEIGRYDKLLEHVEEAKEGMRDHITKCTKIDNKYKKYYGW
jgi:hypothetical protein